MKFIDVFSFILTRIMLGLLSPGSAKAYIGCSGNLNNHLMASCVRNTCANNYQNLIISFQVKVEYVGDAFL